MTTQWQPMHNGLFLSSLFEFPIHIFYRNKIGIMLWLCLPFLDLY